MPLQKVRKSTWKVGVSKAIIVPWADGGGCFPVRLTAFHSLYSIRSAQAAVYTLLGMKREPPAVFKGRFNPRVLYNGFVALHDLRS